MRDPDGFRKGLIRLGASFGVLLLFIAIALLTSSRTVLAVGVVASILTSVVMRMTGR